MQLPPSPHKGDVYQKYPDLERLLHLDCRIDCIEVYHHRRRSSCLKGRVSRSSVKRRGKNTQFKQYHTLPPITMSRVATRKLEIADPVCNRHNSSTNGFAIEGLN